jgi:hypothetical protein
VGRAGLEPATYGLKERSDHEQVRGVNPDLIPRGSFVTRRVLELAASRDPEVIEAARALAAIVLAGEDVSFVAPRHGRRAHVGCPNGHSLIIDELTSEGARSH